MNKEFTKLVHRVVEWAVDNNARRKVLAFDNSLGLWRDVNDFIAYDHETKEQDAGAFPDHSYLYDKITDRDDSFRSYLSIENWKWAFEIEWATSLQFAQMFQPMYGVSGVLYGNVSDNIRWARRELKVQAINGFELLPSLNTSHDEPVTHFLLLNEADAVVVRFAIDDSQPKST